MAAFEQALFGYRKGHQLLEASMPLPPEVTRRLGSLTDMTFDGRATSYLTALPVTDINRYALVKTWPAPEAPRRGSVWSHVLLIDLVVLAEMARLSPLTSLFRRPDPEDPYDTAVFQRPLPPPKSAGSSLHFGSVRELDLTLWATYGDAPSVVLNDALENAEASLLAVWEQQWPRLRRNFAFRTRYRVSSAPSVFAVQIVERAERGQPVADLRAIDTPGWVSSLRNDLPSRETQLRRFLWRFGPQSPDGRRDLPRLVEIADQLDAPNPARAVRTIVQFFPDPSEMRSLKLAVLGANGDPEPVWTLPEPTRLRLLLNAETARSFDFDALEVSARFERLWSADRREAIRLLETVDFGTREDPGARSALLQAAVRHASPADLAAVSAANPEVAIFIVRERGELLAEPTLWEADPAVVDHLLDLLDDAGPQTQLDALNRLLRAGAVQPASRLVSRNPQLWWRVLEYFAEAPKRDLDEARSTVRTLLDVVGAGAIGSLPKKTPPKALVLLATAIPPSVGLWRQVPPGEWLPVAALTPATADPGGATLRLFVVLILAARNANAATARKALWQKAFPSVHQALVQESIPHDDLRALMSAMPRPDGIEDWDHAGRLRAALAMEIRRDAWPQADVARIVSTAAPYEAALLKALAAGKKKKKGWLRELADQILPG